MGWLVLLFTVCAAVVVGIMGYQIERLQNRCKALEDDHVKRDEWFKTERSVPALSNAISKVEKQLAELRKELEQLRASGQCYP